MKPFLEVVLDVLTKELCQLSKLHQRKKQHYYHTSGIYRRQMEMWKASFHYEWIEEKYRWANVTCFGLGFEQIEVASRCRTSVKQSAVWSLSIWNCFSRQQCSAIISTIFKEVSSRCCLKLFDAGDGDPSGGKTTSKTLRPKSIRRE